jgi:ketosteroid isomerase-like protein
MIHSSKLVCGRIAFVLALFSALGFFSPMAYAAPKNGGMPRGQRHESHREIEQREDAWRDAVLKGNAAAMDSLLATDYMEITPNGTLQSREQELADLRSGAIRITSLEIYDRKIRFYRKTALVTCRTEVSGTSTGGNLSGSYRHTRVYVQDAQDKWKIVSFEASRIREPGERK